MFIALSMQNLYNCFLWPFLFALFVSLFALLTKSADADIGRYSLCFYICLDICLDILPSYMLIDMFLRYV